LRSIWDDDISTFNDDQLFNGKDTAYYTICFIFW
jgi:hypothetical protein